MSSHACHDRDEVEMCLRLVLFWRQGVSGPQALYEDPRRRHDHEHVEKEAVPGVIQRARRRA